MVLNHLKFCAYRLSPPDDVAVHPQDRSRAIFLTERCCAEKLLQIADLLALQNVTNKKMLSSTLPPFFGISRSDELAFAYNRNCLRLEEKRDINLLSRVLSCVNTEYGYANCLPSFATLLSLSCIKAMYVLFEMLSEGRDSPIRFIAVNCDLSKTATSIHTFRSALICEMIRVLYEDVNLTELWGTQRVVILGNFASLPDSLPYNYLTRFTAMIEEEFAIRATKSEEDNDAPPNATRGGPNFVRCHCLLVVCRTHIRQLHHLTSVVIRAAGDLLDNIEGLELVLLQKEQRLRGITRRDGGELALLFDPPCCLSGTPRQFRLSWLERRENGTFPLLSFAPSTGNSVCVYGQSYGYGTPNSESGTHCFRSAITSCPNDLVPCSTKNPLVKNTELRSVMSSLDDERVESNFQRKNSLLGGVCAPLATWGQHSLFSPLDAGERGRPQSTDFFLNGGSSPNLESDTNQEEVFSGGHDYILYREPFFRCEKVDRVPSSALVLDGEMPTANDSETSSRSLLSCTLEIQIKQ